MLSLKQCLRDIANFAKSIKTTVSAKQNKTWKLIGKTTSSLSYKSSNYSELMVIMTFGGVETTNLIPVVHISDSPNKLFACTYGSSYVYVSLTKTAIAVYKQPTGYTATLYLYGR